MCEAPVKIDTGLVSGLTGKNPAIRMYKGIPYAAPPVGNLRWCAPQPASAWQGVREAKAFGNSCIQTPSDSGMMAHLVPGKPTETSQSSRWREPQSEDCLYLNVWSPAKRPADKLPVLVYIHGGAFQAGSGAGSDDDGEGLASKGLIVVKFNYRLGIFGGFAHPELSAESQHKVSGNYMLLDQIAALEWVHRNISAFGGDPTNVTIEGCSAGGESTSLLLASPLTRGLIARGIADSGAYFEPTLMMTLKDAEEVGVKFAAEQKAASIAELRAMSAADLMKASFYSEAMPVGEGLNGIPRRPIIDGYVLPTDIPTIFANGKQQDVPMIIGWTSGEGTTSIRDSGLPDTAAEFPDAARKRFGPLAEQFLKAFPVKSDADVPHTKAAFMRDLWFAANARALGRAQAKSGKNKPYLYYWDHTPPRGEAFNDFGAYHCSQRNYQLNTLSKQNLPWGPADWHLADVMSSYWVNFAKTGNPNGPGLPHWPIFTSTNEQSMRFGETIGAIPTPHKQELDFFDDWSSARRHQ